MSVSFSPLSGIENILRRSPKPTRDFFRLLLQVRVCGSLRRARSTFRREHVRRAADSPPTPKWLGGKSRRRKSRREHRGDEGWSGTRPRSEGNVNGPLTCWVLRFRRCFQGGVRRPCRHPEEKASVGCGADVSSTAMAYRASRRYAFNLDDLVEEEDARGRWL